MEALPVETVRKSICDSHIPAKARQLVLKVHEVPIVFDGDAGDEEPVVNTYPFCTHSFP